MPCPGNRIVDRLAAVNVNRSALPSMARSLENDELRLLLIALLHEWRNRIRGSAVAFRRFDA